MSRCDQCFAVYYSEFQAVQCCYAKKHRADRRQNTRNDDDGDGGLAALKLVFMILAVFALAQVWWVVVPCVCGYYWWNRADFVWTWYGPERRALPPRAFDMDAHREALAAGLLGR